MNTLYPEIEPLLSGHLDVGDANSIYWEIHGNPDGKPVVILHGGPGTGIIRRPFRYFDPTSYRIIAFDQRNCGRSTPDASDFETDLTTNTTHYLIADMELLREHLSIEQWMLFGGSWGTTLALAYAQEYPERVTEMILFGVTMTRPSEINWLYRGIAPLFPEQWECFRAGVPEHERNSDLVAAYYRLLKDPDPQVRMKAAQDWDDWDAASLSTDTDNETNIVWGSPKAILARSRIVTHYFHHHAWLEDGILLKNIHKLNGIPGILVQGHLDLQAPLVTAWELSRAWSTSELILVQGAGHSSNDPGMNEMLISSTNRFVNNQK